MLNILHFPKHGDLTEMRIAGQKKWRQNCIEAIIQIKGSSQS